ncbi:MAG: hypothetical protein SVT52_06760, partial [Planctomycetota bacterium]|nr:hypothetical protein [Planctomycetota bacterium]
MRHALIAMAAVLLAVSAPGVAQQVDLPVTRIVLFSSGVGYFEHNGTVEGNAAVKLMFKTGQINDVLKSMVVMDTSGKVTGVNYAASDPLIR